jgi:hypothetical protein
MTGPYIPLGGKKWFPAFFSGFTEDNSAGFPVVVILILYIAMTYIHRQDKRETGVGDEAITVLFLSIVGSRCHHFVNGCHLLSRVSQIYSPISDMGNLYRFTWQGITKPVYCK